MFAVEILGVALPTYLIILLHSRECTVHFRQRLAVSVHRALRVSQLFLVEFLGVHTTSLAHIIANIHSQSHETKASSPDPLGA